MIMIAMILLRAINACIVFCLAFFIVLTTDVYKIYEGLHF